MSGKINKDVNAASKRIQTAVKKDKGIALYLPDVRAVYEQVVADWVNPTKEEIEIVTEKSLTAFREAEETAIIPQPEVMEITKENNPDIWEKLEQEENAITPDQSEPDKASLAPVEQISSGLQPSPEPTNINEDEPEGRLVTTQGYALADTDKKSLIQQQASTLSVELSTSELTTVVGNIADNYASFEDAVQRVKSIILMVLDQRFERASDVLDDTLLTIVNRASGNFQSLNGRASQGFAAIAQELKRVDTDFKSQSSELESSLKQYLLKS
jgi:hypothetical protein